MKQEHIEMCPFCKTSPEWTVNDMTLKIHEAFGRHQTEGLSWSPVKGHSMFEAHEKVIKLFKYVKTVEERNANLSKELEYEKLPWYKKLFLTIN